MEPRSVPKGSGGAFSIFGLGLGSGLGSVKTRRSETADAVAGDLEQSPVRYQRVSAGLFCFERVM